ncbi:hypothetical protein M3201_05870 [Paenibacillus motobuensis]|uniref:hypothetical protein n=1 Tax=Paenibacillus TaxID=44249 RepID=UPI00203B6554|nr:MULTISPECIES: hypothetical protein [Paenibacillus]MCM3039225.1 hypothetical protein [Paenibacillus lutimineralis]MCM3646329.1 hypothetical protein [Paenibacillus motobuensis]
MKITDWAIIFVLIVGPVLWALSLHSMDLQEVNRLQIRYTTSLRTAVQDAGSVLNRNELQQFETGYDSNKYMRADKELALSVLLQSLTINFGIVDDPLAQAAFMKYIPAIVVIDYDGYWIYALDEFSSANGEPRLEHRWHPKKPYVYTDGNGNSVAFTLDSYIRVISSTTGEEVRGLLEDLAPATAVPLLQNAEVFDQVRRSTIVHQIEEDLQQVIAVHNEFTARLGFTYTFTLPTIPQEEWNNTLDDVGIIAFLQGIPVGNHYYNNFALGGGRLRKTERIEGGADPATGIRYYYFVNCELPYNTEEVFARKREAAARGYYEANCRP